MGAGLQEQTIRTKDLPPGLRNANTVEAPPEYLEPKPIYVTHCLFSAKLLGRCDRLI